MKNGININMLARLCVFNILLLTSIASYAMSFEEAGPGRELGNNPANTAMCVTGEKSTVPVGTVQYYLQIEQKYFEKLDSTFYKFSIGVSLITEATHLLNVRAINVQGGERICGHYVSSLAQTVFAEVKGEGRYSGRLKRLPSLELPATSEGFIALKNIVASLEKDVLGFPLRYSEARTFGSIQGTSIWAIMLQKPLYEALPEIALILETQKNRAHPGAIPRVSKTPKN